MAFVYCVNAVFENARRDLHPLGEAWRAMADGKALFADSEDFQGKADLGLLAKLPEGTVMYRKGKSVMQY